MSETDKWLKCSSDVPTKLLLNWKRIKGDSVICCENNMVNRMVLGLPAIPLGSTVPEEELNPKLEAYQKRDVEKLLSIGNVLNANPMGLGKTPETVEMLRQAKAKKIIMACVMGFDFREKMVSELFNEYKELADYLYPGDWKDHRHDQTVMSALLDRDGFNVIEAHRTFFAYYPEHYNALDVSKDICLQSVGI